MAGMEGNLAKPFTQDAPIEAVGCAPGAPRAPAAQDGVGDATACGSHLPVCNAVAFDEVAAMLPSNAVLTYLRTLSARATSLRDEVREQLRVRADEADPTGPAAALETRRPFPRPEILVRQAHDMAGSAGMLGFQRLAFVASRFEQAVEQAAPDGPDLGGRLDALIEASLLEMQRRMRVHGDG